MIRDFAQIERLVAKVVRFVPAEWSWLLDQFTPHATDEDWEWRHRICDRMWGFKADEIERQQLALLRIRFSEGPYR